MNIKGYLTIIILTFVMSSKGQIVINEVMPRPFGGDVDACIQSLYNTSNSACGKEWIELYNANPCDTVDVSCYLLGGKTSTSNAGVFCIPNGSKIAPLGFLTIGGGASGSNLLIPNYLSNGQVCGPSTRWFLENTSGWIALYGPTGTPIDAVYWTFNANSAATLTTNGAFTSGGPSCVPTNNCGATAPLIAANSSSMNGIIDYAGQIPSAGFTIKRTIDGAATWATNSISTQGSCNGVCATPVLISFSGIVQQPTCGLSNGSITINVSSTGAVNYTWSANANTGNTNFATNLSAGTYTCTVNQNGCNKDTVIQLSASSSPTINAILSTNISCNSLSDGSIVFSTVTGGLSPYQYSINNCLSYQLGGSFLNLSAGTYTVCVKDGNNCTATSIVNLQTPPSIQITQVSSTNPNCVPGNNGSISITATGGSGALNYSIDNCQNYQGAAAFSNLSAGTYTVCVKDGNNCTATSIVNLQTPPSIQITQVSSTNPNCVPGNNGSISITATGGSGALNYSIGSGFQTSSIFSGLGSGNYTITVSDANNCTATSQIQLSAPNAPSITQVSSTNPNCVPSNNGSISITATGGSGTLNYSIDNCQNYQSAAAFSNLSAGTYTVCVKDGNNCTATSIVNLQTPPSIQITQVSSTNPNCVPGNNGSISITAIGGSGTLNYSIDNCQNYQGAAAFSNLSAGTYTVCVKDGNNCTATSIVNLQTPPSIQITQVSSTNPNCVPGNNGSVSITATGGSGALNYSIGSGFQTSSIFNGLGSGNYTITVSDANNCTATSQIQLSAPNAPSITQVSSTNPNCVPSNNGSISITATGGSGTLNYSIDNCQNYQSAAAFSNLSAGTYTVCVKDGNNCTATSIVNLQTPPSIQITQVSSTNPNCLPGNNGSISITASGGSGALNYSIDNCQNYQSAAAFSNLSAGTYTVCVKDGNNCTATSIVNLQTPPSIQITQVSSTNPNCVPGNNGSINITASGGSGALNYSIGSGFQTSSIFNGLGSGNYTITVSDANNCTATSQIQLSAPNAPSITQVVSTNPNCVPGNNGSISITATGGSGALNYSIDNCQNYQSATSFSNLSAGTYTVCVKDGNNCTATSIVNLQTPPSIQITQVSSTNPNCVPGNNGSINITATGGSGALNFSIGSGFQTSSIFSGLGSGNYTITVSDANNCTATSQIQLSAPNAPSITQVVSTNPNCVPGNNGSISITATGGSGALNYSIDNCQNYQSAAAFSNLSAGTYTVCVKDGNNCTATSIVNLQTPPSIQITQVVSTNPNCVPGNNGSISITATGGSGALNYSIDNCQNYQSAVAFSNLSAGTYTVCVKDGNNCTATSIVNLQTPPSIQITQVSSTNPNCVPGNNGSINITASGGSGALNFSIGSGFQTSSIFNGLGSGNYTITVSDANNCTATSQIQLSAPNAPSIAQVVSTNPNCVPGNNGSISITATGGSGALNYSIDNCQNYQSATSFSNLSAGTYTVCVKDGNNCTATSIVNLQTPPSIQITQVSSTNPNCVPGNNGSINITATGGSGALNFSIGSGFQTSSIFNGLGSGNYTITVSDANNCTATSQIQLSAPNAPSITQVVSTNPNCVPGNNGSISITATGGSGALNYSIGIGFQTSSIFNGLGSGNYTITVSDANNCTATSQIQLSAPNAPSIAQVITTPKNCNGTSDVQVNLNNGSLPIQYNLSPLGLTNFTGTFTNIAPGNYTVVAVDANQCTVSSVISIPAVVPIQLRLNFQPNGSCEPTDVGSISCLVNGGVLPFTFKLEPGALIQSSNIFNHLNRGNYTITVTDAIGCSTSSSLTIKGTPCCDGLVIPSAFTPNDDGINDEFKFLNALETDIEIVNFIVVNRFGNIVFKAQHFYDRWDGKYKGQPCDIGTYYYLLKYRCLKSDDIYMLKGDITLLK